MRIVAGSARGRNLLGPKGDGIRPTSDRARETLFNVIGPWIEGRVLDLYAGTGALGLEALSRGAAKGVFVDSGREAQALVQRNLEALGFSARAELLSLSAERALDHLEQRGGEGFTFVFADPPYAAHAMAWLVGRLAASPLLAPGATLVVETDRDEAAPADARLPQVDERKLGDTRLHLFRRP